MISGSGHSRNKASRALASNGKRMMNQSSNNTIGFDGN